jgi:hypothetical protein
MYCEWATKPFTYYLTTKAHFNPDRLDFDTIADDYCRTGYGAAAKEVRAYFDAVENASDAAAKANMQDKASAINWEQRVRRQNRLLEALDFDALDKMLAAAKTAAGDDAEVQTRLSRLQFGNDLGRFMKRSRLEQPSKPTAEEKAQFLARIDAYLATDPAAYKRSRLKFR